MSDTMQNYTVNEYHATIHLYGHLLSLATRPISKGNDIATYEAINEINLCTEVIRANGSLIAPPALLEAIEYIMSMSREISAHNLAQVVIESLNTTLSNLDGNLEELQSVINETAGIPDIERLIVSVGPTIGVGDEAIMAKALVTGAQAYNIPVHVETRRFALWNYHGNSVHYAGAPPSGLLNSLHMLDNVSLQKTGYIFADFLASDPTLIPTFMSDFLAFTGRWVFGNATARLVNTADKKIYDFIYPKGMPENKITQSTWFASRIFHNKRNLPYYKNNILGSKPSSSKQKNIVLQPLTSKPDLMLSPEFYQTCFNMVEKSLQDKFCVKIISGPTDAAKAICRSIYDALIKIMPQEQTELCEQAALDKVITIISDANAIVGPDTFSAHIAAHLNVPQITLYLPRHRAWLNTATPSFFLPYGHNMDATLPSAVAKRISFILELDMYKNAHDLLQRAHTWNTTFDKLNNCMHEFFYRDEYNLSDNAIELVGRLETISKDADMIVEQVLTGGMTGLSCPQALDRNLISKCESRKTVMQKIMHWYHSAGSSDLSGIMHNFKSSL